MFGRKKRPPSVKIPSLVLKREAQKMAQRLLKAEKQKEARREKQAKIKAKAKQQLEKKVQRQSQLHQDWQEFFSPSLRQEILGSAWILGGGIWLSCLLLTAPVPRFLAEKLFLFFGVGAWLMPLIFLCLGISIWRWGTLFSLGRVLALIIFFSSVLGLLQLLSPLEQNLEVAANYGGAVGFTLTYFPRQWLGSWMVAGILLFGLWCGIRLGLRISFREIYDWLQSLGEKPAPAAKKVTTKTPEADARWESEVEVIDHRSIGKAEAKDTNQAVADDLTLSKNQPLEAAEAWTPPEIELLSGKSAVIGIDEEHLKRLSQTIRDKLEQFGIVVTMKSVRVGPTVTQFTLEPAAGVKLTKITALKSDLALALAAPMVRIEAPIRGKKLVGIEIPNQERAIVGLRGVIESEAWQTADSLKLALGRDVVGKPMVMDLAKAPHLLVAGKTGSGKSVAINAFMLSLLWQYSPKELKFILIDPKQVELKPYNHLPHLLGNVVTRPEKATAALAWAVAEMNRRYHQLAENNARNLAEYNQQASAENREPYIVVVIDELADLMMVAGKDVEAAICRIAQMARAVGMHLIVATQRPSVDVVTGLIKANLPARIAFRVNTGIDSRTIIDSIGAEDLLGFGDMLYLDGNSGDLTRLQGLYVSGTEIERVTNFIKRQFPDQLVTEDLNTEESIEGMAKGGVLTAGLKPDQNLDDEHLDDRFHEAVQIVMESKKASASFLQRRMELGYTRAAKILDQMEARGIIGPVRGAKAREIFGPPEEV